MDDFVRGVRVKLRPSDEQKALFFFSSDSRVDFRELVKDLVEGYGNLDEPMKNFIDLTLVKHMLEPYNVKKFVINPGAAGVVFSDTDVFRNEAMMKAVANHPKDVILTNTIPPSLIFDTKKKTVREIFNAIIDFFEEVRNS